MELGDDPQEDRQQPLTLLAAPNPTPSSSTSSSPTRWAADDPPGGSSSTHVEKEHLFDKVVTPSDVGKLNRLVIPKQHAERYFPLDTATNDKGLLLNFEDRDGKPWRFRYSYWNSSQSYVMTKGWSRFVKEKRLDAGDTVSFGRGVGEEGRDRLFIDWKRRPELPVDRSRMPLPYSPMMSFARTSTLVPWGRLFTPPLQAPGPVSPGLYGYNVSNPYLYLRSASAAGSPVRAAVQFSSPRASGAPQFAAPDPDRKVSPPKRVRLFGVDLDADSGSSRARRHPSPPLRLSIRTADHPDDPRNKDKQPMTLDLDV